MFPSVRFLMLATLGGAVAALPGCTARDSGSPVVAAVPAPVPRPPAPALSRFTFRDGGDRLKTRFVHSSGMTQERLYPTALGSGAAFCDFDQDGRLDIYLATAHDLRTGPDSTSRACMLRQNPQGEFEEIGGAAAADYTAYGLGVIAGDYDNDGFPDLFLSNYGRSALARNRGDGTLEAAREIESGLAGEHWSCSAAWFDADEDGDLDLYVTTYSTYHAAPYAALGAEQHHGRPMYRSPRDIPPAPHLYYRNDGAGRFVESAAAAGLTRADGRGLGVVAGDVNSDGHMDLYVANDLCPNFLYFGRGDGTFDDVSESSGAAYNGVGRAEAGMGIDAEDLNGDSLPELFVTNFVREQSTLHANRGNGLFQDVSAASGVVRDGLPFVKWGTALLDLDLDTWPDIVVSNGQVDDNVTDFGIPVPYRQPPLVWRNEGAGRFTHVTESAGPYFAERWPGRALAFGDCDDDGDFDLLMNHKDAAPALLINERLEPGADRPDAAWIRFAWLGTRSNRSGIGCSITLDAAGRSIWRQTKGGVSYLSSHDLRLLVGLGGTDELADVRVRWPSGSTRSLGATRTRRTVLVRESD